MTGNSFPREACTRNVAKECKRKKKHWMWRIGPFYEVDSF